MVDPECTAKALVLLRWLDHLESAQPIVHRHPRTARRIRVNIRGLFSDVPTVVFAVYEQAREPTQFAVLKDLHSPGEQRRALPRCWTPWPGTSRPARSRKGGAG